MRPLDDRVRNGGGQREDQVSGFGRLGGYTGKKLSEECGEDGEKATFLLLFVIFYFF